MLIRHSLPKHADIFIRQNKNKSAWIYYKPLKYLKMAGIIMSGMVIFLGTAIAFVPQKHTDKLTAYTIPTGYVNPNNYDASDNGNNGNNHYNSHINYHNNVITTQPVLPPFTPFPSNNFAVNTTPFTPIQPQFQTTAVVTPVPSINQLQPNGQDQVGPLSSQIITIQQQISQQMQACVSNAVQMANQIIGLQNQQKNVQQQLDAVNNQPTPNFDTSTQQGQQQQQTFQQQQQQKQQQLQNQLDALSNAISNAQNNMSNANSQCQQNVSNLEQNRGQLESNLDDAFNNAMHIQIPND